LSSLYFRDNISSLLYLNKTSHILKLKRKERSATFPLYVLTFKEVYIVKSAIEYLVENLYQTDKIFVDCVELHSDFAALSTKKEDVKGNYKYKRATKEKSKKNQEYLHPLCTPYLDICLSSLN
jgi:hypothetical protein